ncbi:MAG: TetR/AcrR family transcriptional regulator [Nocardioidaceae bacterium]|nr:MAG: TetR/AcrR family transcriptional regulator [Nocardioidaceae bacterium]
MDTDQADVTASVSTKTAGGLRTSTDIRKAAAELFYEHGYEATSLRAIAQRVGIKVGSLYNHMGGKDELLVDIMSDVLAQLQPLVEKAAATGGDDPVARFRAAVGAHIRFHAQHAQETFIGNSELRALKPDQKEIVFQARREYDQLMRNLIKDAAASAGVELLDLRLQSYAILALGMHVASWYRDDRGDTTLDHIVDVYTDISCRQVGLPAK